MECHIVEMEAIGVKRPSSLPVFYRCSASRLNTADEIEVTGRTHCQTASPFSAALYRPSVDCARRSGSSSNFEDPVLGCSLRHGYSIRTLPVIG